MKDYIVKDINYISDNVDNFIKDAELAHNRYLNTYGKFFDKGSTWFYKFYNFMCLTSGSEYYYKLFNIIQKEVKNLHEKQEPLWIQTWINYHSQEEVLNWHDHSNCIMHGYVSIRPHKTITEFESFQVDNTPGRMYIGKPYNKHKVSVLEPFDTPRITIAFDIIDSKTWKNVYEIYGDTNVNIGYIPIY